MATLILKRDARWLDSARSYKIYVDGIKIGELNDGETKEFDILSGRHTIKAKIDFFSSKPFNFEIKNEDENVQILVKNNTKIWFFVLLAFASVSLVSSVYKSFFPYSSLMQFVIFIILYFVSIILFILLKPYIKVEQVNLKD